MTVRLIECRRSRSRTGLCVIQIQEGQEVDDSRDHLQPSSTVFAGYKQINSILQCQDRREKQEQQRALQNPYCENLQ